MKEQRKVEVVAKPSEVYDYIKDPRNYLNFDGVTISPNGNSVSATVPVIGELSGRLEEVIKGVEVRFLIGRINTSINVRLSQTESGNTDVDLLFKSNPGFPLNLVVSRYKDQVINGIIDHGLAGKWEIKRKA